MGPIGVPEVIVVWIIAVVAVWPVARICGRAGFSPWLGVLAAVPIANVLLLWFLAFAPWPRDAR